MARVPDDSASRWPTAPRTAATRRVARQLAAEHALPRRLQRGEFADFADRAHQIGFAPARVTRLMHLLLLASEVQAESLSSELAAGDRPVRSGEVTLGMGDWRSGGGAEKRCAPNSIRRY